jgi:hypothetical protein
MSIAAFDADGEVIGTVRTNFCRDTPDVSFYADLYGLSTLGGDLHPSVTSVTTKLMVSPAYRHGHLAIKIVSASYKAGLTGAIKFDFIDCNPPLEAFFQRLGYRRYRGTVHHPEYGEVVPMLLELLNIAHLEKVGSPFVRVFRAFATWQEEHSDEANISFPVALIQR